MVLSSDIISLFGFTAVQLSNPNRRYNRHFVTDLNGGKDTAFCRGRLELAEKGKKKTQLLSGMEASGLSGKEPGEGSDLACNRPQDSGDGRPGPPLKIPR